MDEDTGCSERRRISVIVVGEFLGEEGVSPPINVSLETIRRLLGLRRRQVRKSDDYEDVLSEELNVLEQWLHRHLKQYLDRLKEKKNV